MLEKVLVLQSYYNNCFLDVIDYFATILYFFSKIIKWCSENTTVL